METETGSVDYVVPAADIVCSTIRSRTQRLMGAPPADDPADWIEACALFGLPVHRGPLDGAAGLTVHHDRLGWLAVIDPAATPPRQCRALCHELAEYLLATMEAVCEWQARARTARAPLLPWRHAVATAVVALLFGS